MRSSIHSVMANMSNNFCNLEREYFPIIEAVLQRDIHDIITGRNVPVTSDELHTIYTQIACAKKGMPIPYLTHSSSFFKDTFFVDKRVLIPRNETEYLTGEAILYISGKEEQNLTILDVCTGSGCIGISIAKYVSRRHTVLLSDISGDALAVCKINKERLLPEHENIHIYKSNLLKKVPLPHKRTIDILVSNPPYIPEGRIQSLDISVKDFEPHLALNGGPDGCKLIINLLKQAKYRMSNNFLILLEIDEEQGVYLSQVIRKLFPDASFSIEKDLYGKERYIRIERNIS